MTDTAKKPELKRYIVDWDGEGVMCIEDPSGDWVHYSNLAPTLDAVRALVSASEGLLRILYEHPTHGLCTGPRADTEIKELRHALAAFNEGEAK